MEGRAVVLDIAYLTRPNFFKNFGSVLRRAKKTGVVNIITLCTKESEIKEVLRLCRRYPYSILCTVGIQPHIAKDWNPRIYEKLWKAAQRPECVAIGECGLDYAFDWSSKEEQKRAFKNQIRLAIKVGKPIVVKERDAFDDVFALLDSNKTKLKGGMINNFRGTVEEAEAYQKIGFFIGVSGWVLKDKRPDGIRAMIQEGWLKPDRMILESCAPDMFMNTRGYHKKMRDVMTNNSLYYLDRHCSYNLNEPCSHLALVEVVAQLSKRTADEIAFNSVSNYYNLFGPK